jgi:glycosyltransferase involved in cell wall biosynthesis
MTDGKKIISFSLWGDKPKYTIGAIKNADLAGKIYPGWICRFYCGKTVPASIIERLKRFDNVEIVHMNERGNWRGLFWRFHPASESDVAVMISRDTDSRLSYREKAAVDEWLKSDKCFHIMRDHLLHILADNKRTILGGMWGAKAGCVPGMSDLVNRYEKENRWQSDQEFLNAKIYPLIKDRSLVHDEFFERRPFPVKREGCEFVGQVFDEYDRRDRGHEVLLRRTISRPDIKIPKVSIITSLYKGGKYIKGFLENIVQQTAFRYCELIIIDCNSPDNEADVIKEYMGRYPNIIYKRLDHDPGIYGAWNMAIDISSGEYITNANVDDRRFPEHIEVHAGYLMDFPDVDLVYSEGYYTDVPNEALEATIGKNLIWPMQAKFSKESMIECLPGWCPVWRKNMHARYGMFDDSFKIIGDYEMWLRAVSHNAKFMKIPGVYSIYYLNPRGCSTNEQFKGKRLAENERVQTEYRDVLCYRRPFWKRALKKILSVIRAK